MIFFDFPSSVDLASLESILNPQRGKGERNFEFFTDYYLVENYFSDMYKNVFYFRYSEVSTFEPLVRGGKVFIHRKTKSL